MNVRLRLLPAVALAAAGLVAASATAVAGEAGGVYDALDTSRPGNAVTLTSSNGGPKGRVLVRAECAGEAADSAAFSPAFTRPAVLRPGPDGSLVAEATVRVGLIPGRGYVVTANCSAVESLTTTFVPVPDTPSGPGTVAARGSRSAADRSEPAGGPVDGVTLAFGGGLTCAALTGYVLTARRNAVRRRRIDGSRSARP